MGAFDFTTDQLFWLVALPNLIGSALRIPYTFGPARFGGRTFTVVSGGCCCSCPAGAARRRGQRSGHAVLGVPGDRGDGGLRRRQLRLRMANITYFYPQHKQGSALGLNAAGGNIGVSSVQLVMPLVIGAFGLAAAGWFWVPFVVVAAACAWFFMDNLASAKASPREQWAVAGKAQTWVMSFLYIGTFGSFIATPPPSPCWPRACSPARLGGRSPSSARCSGSLIRPVGGWLSDRLGGAPVTLWNFAAMGAGVVLVWLASASGSFWLFFLAFQTLFVTAGIATARPTA
ncbi:MFS transporter [Nonomuraea dietziae]|uniref:MFS transporter n=1 Tax=Nonomuraea dietziae TaxID=65515 RepID=UPI0031E22F5C